MTTAQPAIGHTPPPTEAGLSIRQRSARTTVMLSGELDIVTAPALRERLAALLRPGMGLVVLDLSDVRFCDAAGLAVLIGTQRRATGLGITFRLAAPRPHVTKLLRVSGLDRVLALLPTPAPS
jgi:anti-anti-sigma factor